MSRRPLLAVLLLSLVARSAFAQPSEVVAPPQTAQAAVDLAESAFQYRDFERVVKLLYPWLHPRRIVEPKLILEARKLLGVSLHVLGRVEESREEFAELIMLDPDHKLDPFLVPPAVVQTFREVRRLLEPTLAARPRGEEAPQEVRVPAWTPVETTPLSVAFLPGGIPQFAADEVGWGLLWAVLQIGFLTMNVVGFERAGRTSGDEHVLWTGVQFSGLSGFILSWAGSSIQGYRQLSELRARRLATPVPSPEPASSLTPPPPTAERLGLSVRWSF